MKLQVMLLGEDLGRRHDGNLGLVFDRNQSGHQGDDGFAAADITLNQAVHRMWQHQILFDFTQDTPLGICHAKWQ